MQFYARFRVSLRHPLYIGGDMDRAHLQQFQSGARAPIGESAHGVVICLPRIPVADVRGEEFPEALLGLRGNREEGWETVGSMSGRIVKRNQFSAVHIFSPVTNELLPA